MVKVLAMLIVLLIGSAAVACDGYGGPQGQPGYYPQQQYNRPQPTVCCRKYWDPYAYTQSYWDQCTCSWVTCWYGAWKTDCRRPCQQPWGGGGGVPYQGGPYQAEQQQVAYNPVGF